MKVLVVVDMQYDFIDGALGTPEAQAIVPNVAAAIRNVSDDTIVIFTKDTHEENYMNTLEGAKLPVPHCIRGTHGWSLHDDVCIAYGDMYTKLPRLDDIIPVEFYEVDTTLYAGIIEKPTFGSTTLQNVLYAIDDAKKVELYKKAQMILAEDAAAVFIEDPANLVAVSKKFGGYTFYPTAAEDMSLLYQVEQ